MAIIKLTKINNVWNSTSANWERTENSTIVFNTEQLITAESDKDGGTHVRYREAMVNGFHCTETLEEFYELCNK
jgi:hypothetical protein